MNEFKGKDDCDAKAYVRQLMTDCKIAEPIGQDDALFIGSMAFHEGYIRALALARGAVAKAGEHK